MSDFVTRVKTINTTVRTVMLAGCLGALSYGGYHGYQAYVQPRIQAEKAMAELEDLQSEYEEQQVLLTQTRKDLEIKVVENEQLTVANEELSLENQKLATSLRLLKVDRRMANVTVLDIGDDENGQPEMLVRFVEVDAEGKNVGTPRDFKLAGNRMYIDCWIVSFDDKYVEGADALRSSSLCVFKSIYGDIDGPSDSMSLDRDPDDPVPGIYKSAEQNAFEQKIWSDFWNVCNDTDKQRELGIRASYGQASYVRAEKGKTYQVQLRSSGGASIKPVDVPNLD